MFVIVFALAPSFTTSLTLGVALLVGGLVLVRPWSAVHGSPAGRALTLVALVPALLLPPLLGLSEVAAGRRIGVQLEAAALVPDDPVKEGGVAKVVAVTPESAAAGRLVVGDRLVSVAGKPLAAADPVADVIARVHSEDTPVDVAVGVLREGALVSVPLHVPWPGSTSAVAGAIGGVVRAHLFASLALRGLCMIAFVIVLARSDGQSLRQLGLVRRQAPREIVMGLPAMIGAMGANLIVAVPIGLVGLAFKDALPGLARTRSEGLRIFTAQGTDARALLAFAATAVFAAAFEELVFRGFLVPRLKRVTGSWIAAVVLSSALFASGHLYEGAAALFQTFAIGAYFALLLLRRGRLESAIVGHALFNVVMFAFIAYSAKL